MFSGKSFDTSRTSLFGLILRLIPTVPRTSCSVPQLFQRKRSTHLQPICYLPRTVLLM